MIQVLHLALITFLFTTSVFAAKSVPEKIFMDFLPARVRIDEIGHSKEKYAVVLKAHRQNRKVAATYGEGDLKPDYKNFRQLYLQTKTADELEALLNKYSADDEYAKLSPDLKFFVAETAPLLALRGIVWRLRPVFESGGVFSGTKATHTFTVTALRALASATKMYFPVDQWDALFAFITEPSKKMNLSMQFKTVADFQLFLVKSLAPQLDKQAERLSDLYYASSTEDLVWDNSIYYGKGTFEDGVRRYVAYGKPELALALGTTHYQLHNIYVFDAYSRNNLMRFAGAVGKLHGLDSIAPGELGVSSRERFSVYRQFENTKFLRLKTYKGATDNKRGDKDVGSYGRVQMANAMDHLATAVEFLSNAHDLLQSRSSTATYAINPYFFRDDIINSLDKGLGHIKAMVKGPYTLRSPITGETVEVNIRSFYENPPENLMSLMPLNDGTGFETGPRERKVKNASGEEMVYRNYYEGRAIKWNNEEWAKYVPSAKGQPANYMIKAARVASMTPGAKLLTWPLGEFVD